MGLLEGGIFPTPHLNSPEVKSEFLEQWLYICSSTKQQPSTAGTCSFVAASERLNWLCLSVTGQGGSVGCKMSRDNVCPLHLWAESAPNAVGEESMRAFMVQFHTTSREMQPPRRVGGPFSQQPGLRAL